MTHKTPLRTDPLVPIARRITTTATGYPAPPDVVGEMTHGNARATGAPGEWWFFATPAAARGAARHGHYAVGTLTTTFQPPASPAPGEYVPAFAGNARCCATCGLAYPCTAHAGPEREAGGRRGMGRDCSPPGAPGECACSQVTADEARAGIDREVCALYDLAVAVGGGFHPDTSGGSYTSLPEGVTPGRVDAVLSAAHEVGVDVYAVALRAVNPR